MFDQLEIMIKLRCEELLAESKTLHLLRVAKVELLPRAAQQKRFGDKQDIPNLTYTLAEGQGETVLKTPHTEQLLQAAKIEDQESDDLGEVI